MFFFIHLSYRLIDTRLCRGATGNLSAVQGDNTGAAGWITPQLSPPFLPAADN